MNCSFSQFKATRGWGGGGGLISVQAGDRVHVLEIMTARGPNRDDIYQYVEQG